jgi:hypothetical protein
MQSRKRLVVLLPENAYRELESLAEREERVPDQQASFMLRQALAEAAGDDPAKAREPSVATR